MMRVLLFTTNLISILVVLILLFCKNEIKVCIGICNGGFYTLILLTAKVKYNPFEALVLYWNCGYEMEKNINRKKDTTCYFFDDKGIRSRY